MAKLSSALFQPNILNQRNLVKICKEIQKRRGFFSKGKLPSLISLTLPDYSKPRYRMGKSSQWFLIRARKMTSRLKFILKKDWRCRCSIWTRQPWKRERPKQRALLINCGTHTTQRYGKEILIILRKGLKLIKMVMDLNYCFWGM